MQTLAYKKSHQGTDPGGHNFVKEKVLNVSRELNSRLSIRDDNYLDTQIKLKLITEKPASS